MRSRSIVSMVVAGMVLAVLAAPSFATELVIPAFWVTPGAGVAWPPAEFGFGRGDVSDVAPVFGGILGVKLAREWGLEVRGHYLKEDELDNLDILHGEGNLTWFLGPEKRFVPLLTAGAGVVRAEDDDASDDTFAWNAGGGALFRFTDQFGIRIDGRYVSYEVEDGLGEKKLRPHTELFAGLNFGFGGAPKDADGDGVPDRADFCADTPMGARVDLQGCPIDGDKDGVADGLDQCDGTPAGATVDAAGCPSDADMDGVLDGIDKCASTAKGAKVDRSGCPIDTDKDGVADGIDTCDSTPKGCTVNASGCPSDADNDGVCDGLDQCADTAANLRVDARGCPIEVTEKETELLETGMIRLQNVNFDTGKATLKEESFAALDEVGDILLRWPELRIEIGGHTDSQGTDAFNQTLSENRAKSVLDYLQGKFKGLAPGQLSSKGYGEATPIAPNDSALNRAKNRRVEFKVLNTEVLKREKERVKLVPKQ